MAIPAVVAIAVALLQPLLHAQARKWGATILAPVATDVNLKSVVASIYKVFFYIDFQTSVIRRILFRCFHRVELCAAYESVLAWKLK